MALTIEERVVRTRELHERKFNCAQCVAVAAADLAGADEDAVFRAAEGFGGGMGSTTETCGAIAGGVLLLGCANSHGMQDPTTKKATAEMSRQLVTRFRDMNGATTCADLLGLPDKDQLRSCQGCIEDALRITCDLLEHGPAAE
jgi:C_GCAxxG_C_C family probable redox protein